jgi:hypothetical protein
VPALFEKLGLLGLDGGDILRVDVVAPEVRVLEIFLRAIAQ